MSTQRLPEELSHETTIRGTINGRAFELKGKGQGRPYNGKLQTRLESTKGPVNFPMTILDIVMQLPTYSLHHEETVDLFKRCEGYEFERRITFENGGKMEVLNKINRSESKLVAEIRVVKGECRDLPELRSMEPIVETLIPDGPGKLRSRCVLLWRRVDGKLFRADCETEYRLRDQEVLPGVQFQALKYETSHSQTVLDQRANLDVFRSYPRRS